MHIEVHSTRDSTFGSKGHTSCVTMCALTLPPKPRAADMASTIKVPVPRAKQEPCQETTLSGKVPMPMAVKSGMPRPPRLATLASNVVASVSTCDDEHWGPWAPPVSADAASDFEDNQPLWPGSVDPTPLQDTRTPCLSHSRRLTPYVESRFGGALHN